MSGFAIVLGFLVVGMLLQKVPRLPVSTAGWLTRYVLYITLPAMVLLYLPRLNIDASVLVPLITPWLMLVLTMLAVVIAVRWYRWPRSMLGALLIVLPLGNTSFLGFPIIESFYGGEGLAYAVLYDQFGSFIGLAVIATTLAAIFGQASGQNSTPPSVAAITRKVVTFPPFLALIVAVIILFSNTAYPAWLSQVFALLATTLVPAVMIAVGLQLRLRVPAEDMTPLVVSLSLKLMVLPLILFILFWLTGLNGLAVQVSLVEAAMPPMITAGAVAIAAGLQPRLVSAIIGYGVLCSVVTLPLWYWLAGIVLT